VYVGSGRQTVTWLSEVLAARDRRLAAPTFDAAGLYLAGVDYPAAWNLPAAAPRTVTMSAIMAVNVDNPV
jgi:tRNA pseudouridine38-40 synthase